MATDSKHARACYHPATAKGLRSAYRPTRTPARACTCKPNLEPASGARAPAAQTCGPAKPPNLARAWTGTASQPCASADEQTASGASAQCLCSRASNSRNAATHKPPCPPPHASTPPDIFAFDARQNFQNATSRWIERSGSITEECKDVISVICHLFWNQRPVHVNKST